MWRRPLTSAAALIAKATELRNAFDRERAAAISTRGEEQTENLLAIRVGKDPYALRVSEISGLTAGKKIVGFPSPVSELLGVAGVRGVLVSVYSLAALLGYAVEPDEARWLALCGRENYIALAFSNFESYLRVPRTQIYPAQQNESARTRVTRVVRGSDEMRAIVSIPLLLTTIQERCHGSIAKER